MYIYANFLQEATATTAATVVGGASSVAARLKKMVHVQNGGQSASHCENGSSAAAAETDGIVAAELNIPDREMVRLLGQHLRSMGMT